MHRQTETSLQTERLPISELEVCISRIEEYIAKNSVLSQDIVIAREEYQEKTGKIKETYPNYESRISSFLYWFIFDWQCIKFNMDTPLTTFCKMNVHKFSPKELEIYRELANHNHSLFEFIKVTDKETVIYDLFKRKKLHIPDVHMLFGFEKGCYFETRIFFIEGKPLFAPFFTTHPFKANKAIWKQVKLLKKTPEKIKDFLLKLQYLNFKHSTYSKFEVDKIYVF